ncbi:MAG: phage major capsid protein [Acidobacteria bacterium]|nr:phage major capsid protein [Acidobacteriota bacterium]
MNPIRSKLVAELEEAKAKARPLMEAAAKDGNRELTAEERAQVQAHLDEAKRIKARIDGIDADAELQKQIDALNAKAVDEPAKTPGGEGMVAKVRKSIGSLFVASDAYKAARASNGRTQFSAGFEVPADQLLGVTLSEAVGSGAALVQPDVVPGILPMLTRRIMITDLLMPGKTDSGIVEYLEETTFTNAAAARAETVAAAESTLAFTRQSVTARSIAHFLPVTNEMLSDVPQTESYVNGRLALGLALAEENEILNAALVPPAWPGLMNNANLGAAVPKAAMSNADAIFTQIMALATASFLFPDGIAINPANWARIVLSKDGHGQYYGNGPFAPLAPVLWGIPCAVTPLQLLGTALVGAYKQGAQWFVKSGAIVTASNSHADYFTRKMVAILAEMRGALATYRPQAFGQVTGLDA